MTDSYDRIIFAVLARVATLPLRIGDHLAQDSHVFKQAGLKCEHGTLAAYKTSKYEVSCPRPHSWVDPTEALYI